MKQYAKRLDQLQTTQDLKSLLQAPPHLKAPPQNHFQLYEMKGVYLTFRSMHFEGKM